MRRSVLAASAAAVVLSTLPAPTATAATMCSGADGPRAAARALYGADTELVRTGRVAGMRTALVLEPRIAPGTRRRMLRTSTGWCDAAAGFTRAPTASRRAGSSPPDPRASAVPRGRRPASASRRWPRSSRA